MSGVARTVHDWGAMIKFSHTVFALPFALLAMFLAARPDLPTWPQAVLILLCMTTARSAAMTFNRIVDAGIDAANPRTAMRQIPSGQISAGAAWLFFAIASAGFVLACGGFYWVDGNAWPLLLSVPVLCLLCFYSYTKRFTRYAHLVLGVAIAFAPVAAWIAIQPATLGPPAWLLLVAVTFWIAGFDVIYACQDAEFDREAGLHSLPSRIGVGPALWTARVFHIITVAALTAVGMTAELGVLYFAGVAIVAALLVVENAMVSPRDLSKVNLAFFTVNGVVGVVLGGLGVLDVLLQRGA